ncbi:MAG: 3-isopropylmalate dehydratase large subunit [Candidatus Heimdallarchaeota archaeon]|nr:3-isopropylmalate dehydratase large subunit [Candidatus Heimdallarchaeota archaeon]
MGQTLFQKIITNVTGKENPEEGSIIFVEPHRILTHDNSAEILKKFKSIGAKKVWNPEKIFIALDHAVPPPDENKALNHKLIREFVKEQGIKHFYDCGIGICHQLLPQKGHVIPGVVILGSDSHTTSHGALGAAGIPIGRTEAASIWAIGKTWLRIPETIKINLDGKLNKNVFAKDIILHIIGDLHSDGASYKSVEFLGNAVKSLSISERLTMCNMVAEMDGKAGMFPADEITDAYLKNRISEPYKKIQPDKDANYYQEHTYNLEEITPVVSKPHNVDNVSPISELSDIEVDVGLLGTCTNGRLDDLTAAAKILKGKKVKDGVRLLVYPASQEILIEGMKTGVIQTLVEAGGELAVPACGPCLGAYGGCLAPGETAISSANRNFKGRMGCKTDTNIYLGSPATVAASVIAGKIVEPPKEVFS